MIWNSTNIQQAADLWHENKSLQEIAGILSTSIQSVKDMKRKPANKELFPSRRHLKARIWTEDQIAEFKSLLDEGTQRPEIKSRFGINNREYHYFLEKNGIVMKRSKTNSEMLDTATALWSTGMTIKKVAQAVGLGVSTMTGIMIRNRDLFPVRQSHKLPVYVLREKPTAENTEIQYSFKEIPAPEGILNIPFVEAKVGQCGWLMGGFWCESGPLTPVCGKSVVNLRGSSMQRNYCETHYQASLEIK